MKKKDRRSVRRAKIRHDPSEYVEKRTDGKQPPAKFKKGNPGKKKGTTDRVPGQRKIRASVRAIIEEVVSNEERTVRQAIVGGLKGGPRNSHHYLRLAAEYTDGKPTDNVRFRFDEDELATAKQTLNNKMNDLLEAVLRKEDDGSSSD